MQQNTQGNLLDQSAKGNSPYATKHLRPPVK